MKTNYSSFYLTMLYGMSFASGMFYSVEFGFFSIKFILSGLIILFFMVCFHYYLKERSSHSKDSMNSQNGGKK